MQPEPVCIWKATSYLAGNRINWWRTIRMDQPSSPLSAFGLVWVWQITFRCVYGFPRNRKSANVLTFRIYHLRCSLDVDLDKQESKTHGLAWSELRSSAWWPDDTGILHTTKYQSFAAEQPGRINFHHAMCSWNCCRFSGLNGSQFSL